MRVRLPLVGVTALAAALAACSGQASGVPTPTSKATAAPASSTASSAAPSSSAPHRPLLAPPVPKPLNFQPFNDVRYICRILNLNQAKELDLPKASGHPNVNPGGASCVFSDHDTGNLVLVNFVLTNEYGLSYDYANRKDMKYFEPVTVQGYPAVIGDSNDGRKSGICAVNLGVTDQLESIIEYTRSGRMTGEVACQKAVQAAGFVVSNLKLQK